MGYLNNSIVTVDAILTKKGRELLSKGDNRFKITQFALSDDEINYDLYNEDHPNGSAYYGEAIERLPLLEAFPDETQMMRYKLLNLTRGSSQIPVINPGASNITLPLSGATTITPETVIGGSRSGREDYYFLIYDARLFSTINGSSIGTLTGTNISKSIKGSSLSLKAVSSLGDETSLSSTISITGTSTGVQTFVRVTVTLASTYNQGTVATE